MANPAYEWTLASDEIDFKLYKGRSTASSALHCGQIEVVGTVDEVVELFRTDTTEQARFYCQRTQRNLVDAVNLYTILAPTAETPHDKIQIKWIVGKSTLSGLFKQRDFCCLEVHAAQLHHVLKAAPYRQHKNSKLKEGGCGSELTSQSSSTAVQISKAHWVLSGDQSMDRATSSSSQKNEADTCQ
ncbi:unnamed protein product [Aphanomyces euteiches]